MTTIEVNRWRIYCITESKYIDGYLNRDSGQPTVCFNNNGHSINSSKNTLIEVIRNDYTPCVIKWKVHCVDENIDVEGYSNDGCGIPTKCYNNDTHTILGTPEKIEIIHNSCVKIKEETRPIQGNIRIETIKMELIPNEFKVLDKTWDIDMAPLSATILSTDDNNGDSLQVDVSPNKIMGNITQDITSGNTVINVNSTIMENINIGYLCNISDGVNSEDVGMVINIDRVSNTITVQNATTNSYLASTPTYIRTTVRYLGPHEISDGNTSLSMGSTKIGASYVPKNEIIRITYINNSNNYKIIYLMIEYLY